MVVNGFPLCDHFVIFLSHSSSQFFKGCMSDMKLRRGQIKVLSSPGYIPGCQLKVQKMLKNAFISCII